MTCQTVSSLLAAYIDAELASTESADLEAHVLTCDRCRKDLADLKIVSRQLSALREEAGPGYLQEAVLTALHKEQGAGHNHRRSRFSLVIATAGLAIASIFFVVIRTRPTEAERLWADVQRAVGSSDGLHMTCTWYRTDGPGEFVQREVWLRGGSGRWDEAGGASALIENGRFRHVRGGSQPIPEVAAGLSNGPSLVILMEGIVRTRGRSVSLERQDHLHWGGKVFNALVFRDVASDGIPLRTIFMVDPATSLPAHGEQEAKIDGRWKTLGLIRFEYGPSLRYPGSVGALTSDNLRPST